MILGSEDKFMINLMSFIYMEGVLYLGNGCNWLVIVIFVLSRRSENEF